MMLLKKYRLSDARIFYQIRLLICPFLLSGFFAIATILFTTATTINPKFLLRTLPIQSKYLIYRLKIILPQILVLLPVNERINIQHKIDQLVQAPQGIYALVDYLNLKWLGF